MAKQKIFQICYNCNGLKEIASSETGGLIECYICNGKGVLEWGYLKVESEQE